MPGFDRKGPLGEGPMSGRRMGKCAGNQPEDLEGDAGFGRGFRFRKFGPRGQRFGGGRRSGVRFGQSGETNTNQ